MELKINTPVIEFPNQCVEKPIVSVIMLTYNHVNYIEQAIQSILAQETNFTYEIIIGEDVSTDGTREKCIALAQQFPEKIRLILHSTENKIFRDGKPTAKFNIHYCMSHAKGKYIAFCEGDDFWSAQNKLQIQVDFLESNTEYVAVFTDFSKYYQNNSSTKTYFNKTFYKELVNRDILKNGFFAKEIKIIRTVTSMYRGEIVRQFEPLEFFAAGDTQLILSALHTGNIKYLAEDTATYRVLEESASHTKDFTKKQQFLWNYIQFMSKAIPHYNLGWKDKRYLLKNSLMYQLRQFAFEKKKLQSFKTALLLIVFGFPSKNMLQQLKKAFS